MIISARFIKRLKIFDRLLFPFERGVRQKFSVLMNLTKVNTLNDNTNKYHSCNPYQNAHVAHKGIYILQYSFPNCINPLAMHVKLNTSDRIMHN